MRKKTESATQITTKAVALNASEPKALARFYEESIGLTLISEENQVYHLGTPDGQVLLSIYPSQGDRKNITGLYHMAFLLPSRKDLANSFKSLLTQRIPLDGASDHGYSEALYLNDPEGNGIEIYADKDQSVWTVTDEGEIVGVTEPMGAQEVLNLADDRPYTGMPNGTIMGHIHLHVHDLKETSDFYWGIMGIGQKYVMSQSALFMASGDYHHHLGANIWRPNLAVEPANGHQGLRETIWEGSQEDLDWIKNQLEEHQVPYQNEEQALVFNDSADIQIRVQLKK